MSGPCLLLKLQGDRQSQAEGRARPPLASLGFFFRIVEERMGCPNLN